MGQIKKIAEVNLFLLGEDDQVVAVLKSSDGVPRAA